MPLYLKAAGLSTGEHFGQLDAHLAGRRNEILTRGDSIPVSFVRRISGRPGGIYIGGVWIRLPKVLTNLRVIRLNNTQITGAGLVNLKGLNNLKDLDLSGTNVTDAGIAELQKALPNCEIEK